MILPLLVSSRASSNAECSALKYYFRVEMQFSIYDVQYWRMNEVYDM